ncbi:MAG: hypothetical protein HY304_06145 [candidate division Zixibacteria bacterium]|nr:hypothetical protein [candidate division Zixibacteria bacterium]
MNTKSLIWIGMFVGSTVAGFLPYLWGEGMLSISGFVCSSVGGLLGIWVGYRVGNSL